jgi:hypothetical protein
MRRKIKSAWREFFKLLENSWVRVEAGQDVYKTNFTGKIKYVFDDYIILYIGDLRIGVVAYNTIKEVNTNRHAILIKLL